jgi:solute carrier family 25 S-adenosylmethionine transporter 26
MNVNHRHSRGLFWWALILVKSLHFQAGAVSGVAVDFILFPLDTIKTRVQSSQGFIQSGGFKGVYRGVGSVGLGSAPGGMSPILSTRSRSSWTAAAFFTTYETLKKHVPKLSSSLTQNSSMTHLLAATGGEFVCRLRPRVYEADNRYHAW